VSPGSTKLVRLTGEGVDTPARLVEFGTPYKNARAILDPALGKALLVEAGESCGE
jgi:hypothetical protein